MLLAIISFGIAIFYARKSFAQPKIEDAKNRVLQAQLTQGLVLRVSYYRLLFYGRELTVLYTGFIDFDDHTFWCCFRVVGYHMCGVPF